MRLPDSKSMPEECGPLFYGGNTEIFRVPDKCCTADVGTEDWISLEEFGSHDNIDGCMSLDSFNDGSIQAILVNGCYDDGRQFYGEKCGGSEFGELTELAYGDCGPPNSWTRPYSCSCNLFVESKTPGCFSIATPKADPQFAVFLRMDGCEKQGQTFYTSLLF